MIVDLSKFHELDPGTVDGSFIEAWIVAWKEGLTAQSHNLDFQSFPKFSFPTSISWLWARNWEFFCAFWSWKPKVRQLGKPWKTNGCTNATDQNKPMGLSSSREFRCMTSENEFLNYSTSMPHWRQYEFPADTSPFYHQEFKIILWQPRSTFYVRLLHMTSSNKAIFQLTTPISHRIAGVNNTSAVRTIWVTAYTFQL